MHKTLKILICYSSFFYYFKAVEHVFVNGYFWNSGCVYFFHVFYDSHLGSLDIGGLCLLPDDCLKNLVMADSPTTRGIIYFLN